MKQYKSETANINIAKELQASSSVAVESELSRLANELDTDIRENLPPQMLAVVVGVLQLIEGIEED